MRIGIALVVIFDLLIRFTDLRAHYTDEGIWPTELLANFGWNKGYWSLHACSGTYAVEFILFSLHLLFAICLLLGFKTRLSTFLVWLLLISLHNRNLFVLQAGDDLLRLILLWGIFLPWQSYYSLDSRRKPEKPDRNAFAHIGYFLLIASVYFFSAILKYSSQWHSEGSAVYYALSLEQLRLPIGSRIYPHAGLLKVLTWLVLAIEFLIVPLILLPSKKGWSRWIAFLLILVLHLGIGLTLYVGLFFVIGIVSALGLLPGFIMDRLERMLRLRKTQWSTKLVQGNKVVSVLKNSLCVILIFLCLLMNLGTVSWFPYQMNDELAYSANALRLNQYWGMFSPGVLQKDGWFVFHGRDSVGRQWDMRRNEDYVDYSKPEHIVSMYKNDRWRKLAENMQSDTYTFLRPLYCKYIIHQWNRHHPEKKLFSLSVYFMEKKNLPDYKTTAPEKVLHCTCYDD